MPELPDVETFKRYANAKALRHRIDSVEVNAPKMLEGVSGAKLRRALKGREFRSTRRHGKLLFIETSGGPWLVLHFGMTGYLDYARQDKEPPRHTRLLVRFGDGYRLAGSWQRRLGRIATAADPDEYIAKRELGPDALDPEIDVDRLADMLRGRRSAIKSALLDQSFIAGVGNVYGDEMLFQARIHPHAKASELDGKQVKALHGALQHVLRMAIERKADPDKLPRTWLLGHREEGAKCPRCGGKVAKISAGGRAGYYCPACQGE